MRRLGLFLIACLLLGGKAWAVDPWSGCPFLTAGTNIAITCPNATTGGATITTTGLPTADASFWTSTAESGLTNEVNLGALTTGLILNTVTAGTAVPSTYAGVTCTNQFVRALDASGAGTCASVANTDLTNSGVTVNGTSNQINTTSASIALGGTATLSLSSTLTVPGALTVTTRSGTPSTIATFDSGGKLVTGASYSTSINYRTCTIIVGADNGALLADADIGPQGKQCFIPAAATVIEITVAADTGTPSVLPRRINASGTTANLVSSALATAASGGVACSNTGGTTGIDGITTCSGTLQNTAVSAGVWLELLSGTAGGAAHRLSVSITYTVP